MMKEFNETYEEEVKYDAALAIIIARLSMTVLMFQVTWRDIIIMFGVSSYNNS